MSAVVDAALETEISKCVYRGENIQEGLRAFVEVSQVSTFIAPARLEN